MELLRQPKPLADAGVAVEKPADQIRAVALATAVQQDDVCR